MADNHNAGPLVLMMMLRDRVSHSALFGSLIKRLAKDMPWQLRTENRKFKRFRVELPEKPLTLSTMVLEKQDGRQSAMVPLH